MFTKNRDFLWNILYVDDILLFTLTENMITIAKEELISVFRVKYLGRVILFMGVRYHFFRKSCFWSKKRIRGAAFGNGFNGQV